MNKRSCAEYAASLHINGKELLDRHISEYGEVLLHVFIPETVCIPLKESILEGDENRIRKYCECVETMWKNGDGEVLNAAEVSVLEYLADSGDIWQVFGKHISREFREYINREYIPGNKFMNIQPLEQEDRRCRKLRKKGKRKEVLL